MGAKFPFVKYGMISDEKFNEKANAFVLLKNLKVITFTLEEYKAKVKDTQTDKHNKTLSIYIPMMWKGHHIATLLLQKHMDIDVLEMDNIIDNHFMQHIEYKGAGDITFCLSRFWETPDQLVQKKKRKNQFWSQAGTR